MAKAPVVAIRLETEQRRVYDALAASAGESFSTFVRTALAKEAVRRMVPELDRETAHRVTEILKEPPPA